METIQLNGEEYPVRIISFFGLEWPISIESLNSVIMRAGEFSSPEAEEVDSQIFFYVDDDKINLNDLEFISEVFR